MLPNKPRGVPRVNDRRVLNGIFWVRQIGAGGLPGSGNIAVELRDELLNGEIFMAWKKA
jgi:hypothetical protein